MIKEGFIVCESSYKEGFLRGVGGFLDYTFISLDEIIKKLTFDVKKEGILKVSLEYGITPEISKEYIGYLKYKELFYDDPKLNYLNELYTFLFNNDMIIFDDKFKEYLHKRPITIMGYHESHEIDFLISLLKNGGYQYEYIKSDKLSNVKRDIYAFFDIKDEARFVFNSIKRLLDEGFPISNIKIANYSSEYDFVFHRLENHYNIPINFEAESNVLSSPICRYLLSILDSSESFYDCVDKLKEKYPASPYLKNIINIVNSYHLYNYKPSMCKDLIKMEIKNIKFERDIYEDGIMLTSLGSPSIKSGDKVFVIGVNQGVLPRIYTDKGYLTNDILKNLGLDTSSDLTRIDEEVTIHNLNLDIDYVLSYKKTSPFASYLPSTIIDSLGYNVIEASRLFGMSKSEDMVMYGEALDDYNKYGIIDSDVRDNIFDIRYNKYDNSFKGINKDILDKFLPQTIKLSYSSTSNYFKCAFRYLMSSVLYLDKFEERLEARLGTYAHKILELSYEDNFTFEGAKEEAIKVLLEEKKDATYDKHDVPLTNKEKFFIEIMDIIVKECLEFNKLHEEKNGVTSVMTEKEFEIPYDDGKLVFKGFADKILVTEDEKTYVAIVDYKTGKDVPSMENVESGFHLQLPLYAFMIRKHKDFKNPIITGFYLQKISTNDYPDFKLKGYTNISPDALAHADRFDKESLYIENLKYTKTGFYVYARLIDDNELDELCDLVEKLILSAYDDIRGGKFNINPKKDGKNIGCEYCKFSDVCFKRMNDEVAIKHTDFIKDRKGDGSDGME